MIWLDFRKARLIEPGKPLQVKATRALDKAKEEAKEETSLVICPNCQFANKPGGLICEKCGLHFDALFYPLK
jgi:hypothetical protein